MSVFGSIYFDTTIAMYDRKLVVACIKFVIFTLSNLEIIKQKWFLYEYYLFIAIRNYVFNWNCNFSTVVQYYKCNVSNK